MITLGIKIGFNRMVKIQWLQEYLYTVVAVAASIH